MLIDDILPSRRIHLLGGVSDAGKTRWLLPAMLDWEQAKPVLGKASHPVPWAYVVGDRLLQEAHDTMIDTGINPTSVRTIPAFGRDNKNWNQIMIAAAALRPTPELLVVEGFSDLCEDPQTKRQVRDFLSGVAAYCDPTKEFPNGLTVLGVVESPKLKPHERYPNPRQRISGVSAWAYHASTVFVVEQDDQNGLSCDRTLWVCMKNSRRLKLRGAFNAKNQLVFP